MTKEKWNCMYYNWQFPNFTICVISLFCNSLFFLTIAYNAPDITLFPNHKNPGAFALRSLTRGSAPDTDPRTSNLKNMHFQLLKLRLDAIKTFLEVWKGTVLSCLQAIGYRYLKLLSSHNHRKLPVLIHLS